MIYIICPMRGPAVASVVFWLGRQLQFFFWVFLPHNEQLQCVRRLVWIWGRRGGLQRIQRASTSIQRKLHVLWTYTTAVLSKLGQVASTSSIHLSWARRARRCHGYVDVLRTAHKWPATTPSTYAKCMLYALNILHMIHETHETWCTTHNDTRCVRHIYTTRCWHMILLHRDIYTLWYTRHTTSHLYNMILAYYIISPWYKLWYTRQHDDTYRYITWCIRHANIIAEDTRAINYLVDDKQQ